jgi:hypothetical protein
MGGGAPRGCDFRECQAQLPDFLPQPLPFRLQGRGLVLQLRRQ